MNSGRARTVVSFFMIFSLLSCGGGGGGKDPELLEPFSEETQTQLADLMNDAMSAYGSPGMILGIWRDGHASYLRASGIADIGSGRAAAVSDVFRVGSVTKTFTSTIILQLVDEGALRLDDTLHGFSEGAAPGSDIPFVPFAERITIRNLLSHTSGIAGYREGALGKAWLKDPSIHLTPRDLVLEALERPPRFEPGERFEYSDTNYILLGMLIEQLMKSSVESEIDRRIALPLGMTHTYLPKESSLPEPFMRGYLLTPGSARVRDLTRGDPSFAWAAGGVISTVEDLRTYAEGLIDGALLSGSLQSERMSWWEPKSEEQTSAFSHYGYGLGIEDYSGFVGHSGAAHAFNCIMARSTARRATIVAVLNSDPATDLQVFLRRVIQVAFPDVDV